MAQKFVPRGSKMIEHGQHIFIYGHVRTRQIVYSLSRTLDNNSALKQLPFLGKKTVPPVIRKDFWQPLATVFFPSGHQGLSAYRQLREFRKRHELEWDLAPIRMMPKKKRGKLLQDQKANSIADLAAILEEQAKVAEVHTKLTTEEEDYRNQVLEKAKQKIEELKRLKAENRVEYMANPEKRTENAYKQHKTTLMKLKKLTSDIITRASIARIAGLLDDSDLASKEFTEKERGKEEPPRLTMDGIRIEWANILDAEFAKTWPEAVVHDRLTRGGNRQRHVPASSLIPQTESPVVEEVIPEETQVAEEPVQEVESSRLKRIVDRLRFGRQPAYQ